MPKVLRCRDVGAGCDWETRGETEEAVLRQATEHARTVHNMAEIPKEMVQKVKAAIHDE